MQDIAPELHALFNSLKRYSYPFENLLSEIPKNGIYVKFEKGEKTGSLDRVVRIGTDTGDNQLHSRLFQHFQKENQRRSIFRKNIGRAILKRNSSDYLKYWELNITSKVDKEKNLKFIDLEFEKEIEKQISGYIHNSFTFCVFKVETKEERLFWESKIIATIAQSNSVKPSVNWLGNHSPKEKIRQHGLWQIQELKGSSLTQTEFENLKRLII